MRPRFKTIINVILNATLLVATVGIAYSWMITVPSTGEILDYNRELIVTSSAVTVEIYAYTGGRYVKQTGAALNLGLLAPGVNQKYRFDITNNMSGTSSTKIVFSDITGDIADLSDLLIFGCSSPRVFSFDLGTKVLQNQSNGTYYFNFIDSISVEGNTKVSLYWYVSLLNTATNEIGDKGISIGQISFIEP